MKIWKTIDKFFSEDEIKKIYKEKTFVPFTSKWYDLPISNFYHTRLFEEVKEFTDISSAIGFEQWTHDASFYDLPEWHYDKDEKMYQDTGVLNFPICSIILYLKVKDLVGANLAIKNTIEITPETGKVVFLAPGVLHGVTKYESGSRLSLNINLWNRHVNEVVYRAEAFQEEKQRKEESWC